MIQTFVIRVYRGNPGKQYFEEFELPWQPSLNVISVLMEIQKNPVNRQGEKVAPIVWEQGCLEEVCGSCSMLINGRPRQACTALIDSYLRHGSTITLAPFTKFPLVRDLIVDRSSMFAALEKVKAYIEVDKLIDRGPGPKVLPENQQVQYLLSTCMTCGCCAESCPQSTPETGFIGPAAISQVRRFNAHPLAASLAQERVGSLMGSDGVATCGNAQNCQVVCPKNIPLLDSIAWASRETTKLGFTRFFGL